MVVTALKANTAYRLQRTFKWATYIIIQVRVQPGPGGVNSTPNFIFSHDQGAVLNGIQSLGSGLIFDGFRLSAGNTDQPSVPYDVNWQGELWYAADRDNAQFSIEMGTETSQRRA